MDCVHGRHREFSSSCWHFAHLSRRDLASLNTVNRHVLQDADRVERRLVAAIAKILQLLWISAAILLQSALFRRLRANLAFLLVSTVHRPPKLFLSIDGPSTTKY